MDEKNENKKSHLKFCRLCPGLSITNPTFEFRQLKIIHGQEICDFLSMFFFIVFPSQHFQWCSSRPTERNHDQEIWNLFQYKIFFLLGYFKSYQSSHFSLVIWRRLPWWDWKILLSLNIWYHLLLILKICLIENIPKKLHNHTQTQVDMT